MSIAHALVFYGLGLQNIAINYNPAFLIQAWT